MALLEIEDVTVHFGGVVALSGVGLSVEAGQVVGLIGPNGAGKTTLFDVITGLREPTSGRIRFDGRDVTGEPPRTRARRGIGRTFQRLEVFGSLSVADNIRVAAEMRALRDRAATRPEKVRDRLLDRVGLRAFTDVPADAVPTGIARMTELARALAGEPALLLLDEPSSGLDERETTAFMTLLGSLTRDDGRAVLLVEHDVELVLSVCSTVYVLDVGRVIASGSPEQVRANRRVQEAYLGGQERTLPPVGAPT